MYLDVPCRDEGLITTTHYNIHTLFYSHTLSTHPIRYTPCIHTPYLATLFTLPVPYTPYSHTPSLSPGKPDFFGISTDLYPTFLDAAGLKIPSNVRLDGISLLPLLWGTSSHPHARR